MRKYFKFALAGIVTTSLFAVQTKVITHSSINDFLEGQSQNFSIFDNEGLHAIPPLSEISSLPASIIFDVKENSAGHLFTASGNPAKVFQLNAENEVTTTFSSDELFAKAIAINDKDELFIATSPSGTIYKQQVDKSIELFFSPNAQYIWDIEFLPSGELLVATGEPAHLYKIPASYKYGDEIEPIFAFEQKHFTKINVDKDGSILLGSSPDALLFELSTDGTIKRTINAKGTEVTQISPHPNGIYFSTISSNDSPLPTKKDPNNKGKTKPKDRLYRWNDNGFLETLWAYNKKPIFTFWTDETTTLIGSGSDGHIFASKNPTDWGVWNQLPKGGDINHILQSSYDTNRRYFITSNPAVIYLQDANTPQESIFTSQVIDASQIVSWGKLHMIGQTLDHTHLAVRFGNTEKPDASWSEWTEQPLVSPSPSQYAQYKISSDSVRTKISKIKWYYRLANQPPEIGTINVVPIAVGSINVIQKQDEQLDVSNLFAGKSLENILIKNKLENRKFFLKNDPNHITISWQSRDANQDELVYELYIQTLGNSEWVAIAKDLDVGLYTFSANGMKPGYYKAKIVASDAISNPEHLAKSSFKISEQFLIDNTNPEIEYLGKSTDNQGITTLNFEVKDDFSVINEASILINGEKKYSLIPDDGFFDQSHENFSLKLSTMSIGIHSLVFEVKDESRNQSIYQHTFTID